MRCCALMRYYQPFPAAIPLDGPGYPHVTHPSATKYMQDSLYASTSIISAYTPFDLHVLGTPPAFILSQDRTLELIFWVRTLTVELALLLLLPFLTVSCFCSLTLNLTWFVVSFKAALLFNFQGPCIACFKSPVASLFRFRYTAGLFRECKRYIIITSALSQAFFLFYFSRRM